MHHSVDIHNNDNRNEIDPISGYCATEGHGRMDRWMDGNHGTDSNSQLRVTEVEYI